MDSQRLPGVTWDNAEAYEQYVGRWSRLVAREFLDWLDVSPNSNWLDVGCGTGALTQTILETAAPAAILGVDPSLQFIARARENIADPRVRFEVGDARELPVADGQYDAVLAGLVLQHVPVDDQLKAVSEMSRAGRPGAVVAAYLWDYAGEMQMTRHFWDAAVALDPAARKFDQGLLCPLCHPEPLEVLFRDTGLALVEVRAIDIPTDFTDFDDYWRPFLGGTGAAPGYVRSLSEAHLAALRDQVRSRLPTEADHSIHLTARAWAVRGMVPRSRR
jgi:SAM-dependent methyltransferase